MNLRDIVSELESRKNPKNVLGMQRFGINSNNTLGVSMPELREIAKRIKKELKGKDKEIHNLALGLWGTKIHEARILAGLVDLPEMVSEKQADKWILGFDSWDVCDQVCMNLFDKASWAFKKAVEWSKRKQEFSKRAGFALMASLAFHNKNAKDKEFINFFSCIEKESIDERNFVKKSVNWALRQIGKRNKNLNKRAIEIANRIQNINSKSAKWIAANALKELKNPQIQKKLSK